VFSAWSVLLVLDLGCFGKVWIPVDTGILGVIFSETRILHEGVA
jgi:hypothetical protein